MPKARITFTVKTEADHMLFRCDHDASGKVQEAWPHGNTVTVVCGTWTDLLHTVNRCAGLAKPGTVKKIVMENLESEKDHAEES